ncbi:type I-E CRISPR-associated protein Cas6/Cse3/CasE [Marinobacter sp. X15-166B]|uniref:type I-E CRISPR-associated protein Cas6/Cse3/CasE n=1 Tax=Marinobacter sp. X15-166B TaxID=1897620 RepID=UPI00085BBFD5|nr:type I-E CRISPR-associated protein Cas6/Cse3/CasE [Marinobacter sp. X15-166B]OEY65566.1 type I-E CRISPR-associated protein Cas6/Cse3/CasE [Marinobacter sp. X15-166B]
MFLSKVTLSPSRRMAEILLKLNQNGAYSSHQLLWQLFSSEKKRQFIYRQELSPNGLPVFFVLSQEQPDPQDDVFKVQVKTFEPKLSAGQRLVFKLRANPTICVTDEQGRRKRHDVLMHAKKQQGRKGWAEDEVKRHMDLAAHEWIANEQRLESWGISLESLPDIGAYTQHRSQKKKGQQIQFSSVDYQGVVTVANPSVFLSQYARGFGRAKALGCGLMLIRPL